MYERSIADPAASWASEAKRIHWFKAPSKIKNVNYGPGNVSIKWFEDVTTNVAHNCIDRHLGKRTDRLLSV
jgi:acetyl-CoA synthetase